MEDIKKIVKMCIYFVVGIFVFNLIVGTCAVLIS